MNNSSGLVVSVFNISDLEKITKKTKYINIDITNPNDTIIAYFINNGTDYLYTDIHDNNPGYIYVSYDSFYMAENIINNIYKHIPKDLTKVELAKYLYISLAKYTYFDINTDTAKNELYNLSLITNTNNIWGSLSSGRVNHQVASKLYYYLCRRLDIDASINLEDNTVNLTIDNQSIVADIFSDIPYIGANMKTRYFNPYNNDADIDKSIGYLKNHYSDYYLDKALKNIDYTDYECVWKILKATEKIIPIDNIHPAELNIIYKYIFDNYCPNYDIKINNLYLNDHHKLHFILFSYNNIHYSYNYKQKTFVIVNDNDLLADLDIGKIGIYQNEFIPSISSL